MAKPLRPDYIYQAPDGENITITMDAKRAEQIILYARGGDAQRQKVATAFINGFDDMFDLPELVEHGATPQKVLDDTAALLVAQDKPLLDVLRAYKGNLSEAAQKLGFPEEVAMLSGDGRKRKHASGVALVKRKTLDPQFESTIKLKVGTKTIDAPINGKIIRSAIQAVGIQSAAAPQVMAQSLQMEIYLYLSENYEKTGKKSLATRIKKAGFEFGEYAEQVIKEALKGDEGQIPALMTSLDSYIDENITHVGRVTDSHGLLFGKNTRGDKGGRG